MDDSTYRFVKLFFVILSFSKKSHGLTFEKRLCENSTVDLTCPSGNAIEDINILFHDIGNSCSLTNDGNMGTEAMNSSYPSCIGHNSCVLTDKMLNVSHLVADKTWKLNIDYHCVRKNINNSKTEKTVCPYNMESVTCGNTKNKIEIQSVEVMMYSSFCENHILDQQCTELTKHNVIESCNINNTCQPIIWTKSVNTWDDCIRIPKFVNISFSCKAITTERLSQDETSEHGNMALSTVLPLQEGSGIEGNIGVAVGVIVGLIVIVGVVVLYLVFVRRKNTDDKHDIASNYENADYVGNQNIALPANCTSENSTNLELRINDRKETNKSDTILETGCIKDTDNQYYNSANFSTALEPNRTDIPVHHSNANDYEMAKPIDDFKYDKNTPTLEKDNYAFNEDQYNVSGKHDGSDYQQGIYIVEV
ncbi:uncharacterized protein LOC134726822 [Mytilus trossulus]|uniref:uncharacterized protein LOC134726822 n=1 Tax=Mytilus trossulus TaxID=6551 RepID=UPI00300628CF